MSPISGTFALHPPSLLFILLRSLSLSHKVLDTQLSLITSYAELYKQENPQ